ncbi:MAG: hypothetical protein ABR526_04735 [Chthoniobacterales bacterium]
MKANIDKRGRLARGGIGILLLLGGACLLPQNIVLAVVFFACGIFALFEAYRGWCGVRACGIKTPF